MNKHNFFSVSNSRREKESRKGSSAVSADNNRATDQPNLSDPEPIRFEQVLQFERESIHRARERLGNTDEVNKTLCGLAFSGGGIRSATFNLGVIQALAELRLLTKFDYLSTVSGGGYIGSWLSALIYRAFNFPDQVNISEQTRKLLSQANSDQEKWKALQAELAPNNENNSTFGESPAISHLRSYSNYLTPRRGLLKADTLASISTYLRNTFLNLIILICIMGGILFLPPLAVKIGTALDAWKYGQFVILGVIASLTIFIFTLILLNLSRAPKPSESLDPVYVRQYAVMGFIILPTILAALSFSAFLHVISYYLKNRNPEYWVFGGAVIYLLIWGMAWLEASIIPRLSRFQGTIDSRAVNLSPMFIFSNVLAILFSGAVGGWLFHALFDLLPQTGNRESDMWLVVGFVTPASLLLFNISVTIHIGLAGRMFSEATREWWSRLGGWTLLALGAWLLLFATVIYTLPLVVRLQGWIAGGGLVWLATSIAGILFARSPKTGDNPKFSWYELLAMVAPYVFVLGLCFFLTYALQMIAASMGGVTIIREANGMLTADAILQLNEWNKWQLSSHNYHGLVNVFAWLRYPAALFVIAVLLSWRVDINLFSIYQYYKNRLVRAYLGASRSKRQANPFTGFDMADDLPMSHLQSQRPYHIVNSALNLVSGKELAWQQRKAAAFSITPKFSGFQLSRSAAGGGGYRRTDEFLGTSSASLVNPSITLGQALSISGAAASPNMGYHSSPALAFLMTVFNVRLGRWCGNPAAKKAKYAFAEWTWLTQKFGLAQQIWQRDGPQFGAWYLLRELFSSSNEGTAFVYLSDGGHFENLAMYELVRRRCKLIFVCDAGADKSGSFADLGNAIRKCYIDLGVEIELNLDALRPDVISNRSQHHYAVGTVHYETADNKSSPGTLLYIKTSLCDTEPSDILNYAAQHNDFPHESTADQWFDEGQFESYRKLGYHITKGVFDSAIGYAITNRGESSTQDTVLLGTEELINALRQIGEQDGATATQSPI